MMLAILRCIVQCYGITKGSIRLGLDGKKAMEQAGGTFPLYPTQRSFDMLVDIRAKIQQLPISVTLFWVEGHQIVKHGHQSYLGKLNDQCDTMAKIYWSITARQQPKPNQLFHDSPWSISVQGKVVVCFNTAALYDYIYGRKESVPYWQEDRQPFSVEHEHNIAWSAITKASRLWPWGETKWQTKLWTGLSR